MIDDCLKSDNLLIFLCEIITKNLTCEIINFISAGNPYPLWRNCEALAKSLKECMEFAVFNYCPIQYASTEHAEVQLLINYVYPWLSQCA